jgi:hypothetical protein
MKFNPGDKVEVIGRVPHIFTALFDVKRGMQGEVVRVCSCELMSILLGGHATRVHFPYPAGKVCVPTKALRLIPGDEGKLADYTWEPKNVKVC